MGGKSISGLHVHAHVHVHVRVHAHAHAHVPKLHVASLCIRILYIASLVYEKI